MSLPPLIQIITADASQFDNALGRSVRGIKKFAAAGAIAVGAVSAALVVLTKNSLQTIDAQAKLARAVGGTTAAIQALERAGDRAGVQSSELAAAATRLNQRLGEVIATGKGATDTFKVLGLSAGQLAAMDVDERFMALSDAMLEAGMSTQEMAFHLRELGIRQTSVITLLQGGSKEILRSRDAINALGVSVSDVDAAQIELANDALAEMGRVFEGIGNRLAVRVAPVLERVAGRFVELAQIGGPLDNAITALVHSFGQLADKMTQDDFLNSASMALGNLIGFAGGTATAMIFLANNVELVTAALVGLTLAWMGFARTPIGLALTVAAAAAVALALAVRNIAKAFKDAATPAISAAEQAQIDLNAALGVFRDTGAPGARQEAIALSQAMVLEAHAAYEAAAAHRDLEIARLSGLKAQSGDMLEGFGDAIIGTQTGITEEAIAEFEVAADRAQQAQNGLRLLMNDIMNQPTGPAAGITLGGDGDDDGGGNGGGDGGGGSDPLSDRLVALTESLATEAEIVAEWYAASQDTLMEALEAKQLTEEEYRELRERLEKEHQDRMAGIRDAGESRGLTSAKGFFDGMAAIAQAGGQKTVKIAAAIGAVQGLIDAYGAALKALNSPEPLTIGQRFAAYAGVLAAGLKGVMSIQQAGRSGSAAGAGGAASGATASAAPAMARQNIVIDLVGDTFSGDSVRALFSQINDGLRSGYQIEGVLAR